MMSIVQSSLFPHSLLSRWTEIITCLLPSPGCPFSSFGNYDTVYLDTEIGVWQDWEGLQGFILSTVRFAEPEIIIHYRYPFCVQNRNSKRQQS